MPHHNIILNIQDLCNSCVKDKFDNMEECYTINQIYEICKIYTNKVKVKELAREETIRGYQIPMNIITFNQIDNDGFIVETGMIIEYGHLGL